MTEKYCDNCKYYIIPTCYCQLKEEIKIGSNYCENWEFKKRFELQMNSNGQVDIVDWVESEEKDSICIYNDLGVLPFSSAGALCDLLNQQENKIELLKKEGRRQNRQKKNLIDYLNIKKHYSIGKIKKIMNKEWWL